MHIINFSITPLALFSAFLLLIHARESDPPYTVHQCKNQTFYQPNTTFQSNLNTLFSSLISNSSLQSNNGFYTTTVGQNTTDVVNGLFLCRGDVNATLCHGCVATAANDITRLCPNDRESIIWSDFCMLHYSESTLNNNIDTGLSVHDTRVINSNIDKFNQLFAELLYGLAEKAAAAVEIKYAAGEKGFTSTQTLYGMAQCVPELTREGCTACLQSAIRSLTMYSVRAEFMFPACHIRYQLYPFLYNTTSEMPRVPSPSSATSYFMCEDESLRFDLATIEAVTNGFSDEHKIGEGGFGEVYKGTLPNGQEIAVKRLSRSSRQGDLEFKNEASLVAQLQHRNLVRLLGFCLERKERILVYEFIPNSSLDNFLFDRENEEELDWARRYQIIVGIARGMKYLHEDSRLRIIHRDLKASNVLLDANMNPKISDFGLAKISPNDQSQVNAATRRIVGTYGYMSPEYAMHGKYSVKSDVFSFGVLVLEIIHGKKNSSYYLSHESDDLLSITWKNWTNQTPFLILDPRLNGSYSRNEVRRCIQIALLCAQENPVDRPSMATIVIALSSYSITLAQPRQPASYLRWRTAPDRLRHQRDSDGNRRTTPSCPNDSLITEVYPR
ncbi:cysteine-rich receptor-like protein kinase 25 [Abrus precatorius]|uniref:Cysteine-rich receptor-like protein kinase 25 n=1 Tax=Abrus precatorius TaxID=3816 RepID=A0A8B8MAB6_ABRPR|nr:cysteine-rich receptor-like protein kinase 25 [Abrus precatorius]